ncbi:MAG: THxN family PEP-CTERM protein [Burkholderiaceae bacterium]
MSLRRTLLAAAFSTSALLAAGPAYSATVTFENLAGTWSAATGGTNVNYSGNGTATSQITWGIPSGQPQQSGYSFAAVTSPTVPTATLPPSPSNDLVLGTFTHFNFPINSGSGISAVQLTISASVKVDGVLQGSYSFVYDFAHWETPNGNNPCADGGTHGVGVNVNGCADRVTMNYNSLSDSFTIGGDLYTLDIRGFELMNGSKVYGFWTTENLANSAYILGRVALTSEVLAEVPAPATLLLLSAGLIGAGVVTRRRSQR